MKHKPPPQYKHNHSQLPPSRRNILQAGALLAGGILLPQWTVNLLARSTAQLDRKRIYLAPDDHTDYFWIADGETYQQVFLEMLDYYLDLADTTENEESDFQSRWNCDGSFWLWTYERNRTPEQFERLIGRIRDGHISAPLTPLVILYGGAPAEAVLRSMYYAGQIERRYDLRFTMAVSMENQTLPYGLVSLWAGAGAKYSWKGVCGCASRVPDEHLRNRDHEIYWWEGPDNSRILMKWYSLYHSRLVGGYAEANVPLDAIAIAETDEGFLARYPYEIIGLFGKGHDRVATLTDEMSRVAKEQSNESRRVIVSNEEDFFLDFESVYGTELPVQSGSLGNEWDLYCASMAEVSADVKRLTEKLRTAESLAVIATLTDSEFMANRKVARDLAWMSLGLYWEHNWTADGPVECSVRAAWQVQLRDDIAAYVDTLQTDALAAVAQTIPSAENSNRFFVYNSLNWSRTDIVDLPYNDENPVHVIDLTTGEETPSQVISEGQYRRLRILAADIPAVGYKVFEIHTGSGQQYEDAAITDDTTIENEFVRVTLSTNGAIASIFDKTQNREFVQAIDERAVNDLGESDGSISVEDVGAVSVTLVATAESPVAHTTRITLIRGSNRIDIRNEITENFSDVLTWGFNFAIENPTVWHEEVGAVINAKLTSEGGHYAVRSARYDWLTINHFADMSSPDSYGITLSNSDCYFMTVGHSTAENLDALTPSITVLAGGQVDGPSLGILEQNGDTYFLQRFALRTHTGYSAVDAMRFALQHQNPLIAGQITGENPVYPAESSSFLNISNSDVMLWALKPADDSASVIARLWNLNAAPAEFSLEMTHKPIASAESVSHIETPIGTAAVTDQKLTETLGAHQMRTFAFNLGA